MSIAGGSIPPSSGGRPAGDTDPDPLDLENLGILKRFRDGPR